MQCVSVLKAKLNSGGVGASKRPGLEEIKLTTSIICIYGLGISR